MCSVFLLTATRTSSTLTVSNPEATMEFLNALKSVDIPFDQIYLDPNNPRIAPETPPGYDDPAKITQPEIQTALAERINKDFDTAELEAAILGQGWVPIDAVVVWKVPGARLVYVVVEGNRRVTTLKGLHKKLKREEDKLASMRSKKSMDETALHEQERLVGKLAGIQKATCVLPVQVVVAKNPDDLASVLPRILGVRHLAGVKAWLPSARGLYLLRRYTELFRSQPRNKKGDLRLEDSIVATVAAEASLGVTVTRRTVQAMAAYNHFKAGFEDRLPEEEEFVEGDLYPFSLIGKSRYLRELFGFQENALKMSDRGEEALFQWVFKEPRPDKADDNDNIFYRHENLQILERLKRHDDKHGTAFALRFDVDSPEKAPQMRLVEGEWRAHEARQEPALLIQRLIDELGRVPSVTLIDSASVLLEQLDELEKLVKRLKKITAAAQE